MSSLSLLVMPPRIEAPKEGAGRVVIKLAIRARDEVEKQERAARLAERAAARAEKQRLLQAQRRERMAALKRARQAREAARVIRLRERRAAKAAAAEALRRAKVKAKIAAVNEMRRALQAASARLNPLDPGEDPRRLYGAPMRSLIIQALTKQPRVQLREVVRMTGIAYRSCASKLTELVREGYVQRSPGKPSCYWPTVKGMTRYGERA